MDSDDDDNDDIVMDLFGDAGEDEDDQMVGALMAEHIETTAGERREAKEILELFVILGVEQFEARCTMA